jgi:hypothetical protein
MFICGSHPKMVMFHPDVEHAARFGCIDEALAFRSLMDYQLGGTEKYRVHELLPDGRFIDVEG